MDGLAEDIENVGSHLVKKQENFDKVAKLSRDIIRNSGKMITMLHNGKIADASQIGSQLHDEIIELKRIDAGMEYYSLQAYQEYAEAMIFSSIKNDGAILRMQDTGVSEDAYILGLLDVVGELKREIFEALRERKIDLANKFFDKMKDIYDTTRSLRFAEATLQGLRKKQDVARIQIENAGNEILYFNAAKQG
ncbi:hypothetical protein M1439_02625 [Candidatus Marsarchaeota archaeon]|jgi:translin|nr:hypothetical protein [Candidatus Marsarchaeota archaeon]